MPESWRIENLERENERLDREVNRLKTQVQVFVDDRNQLIGMSKAARWGVKLIFALGGYGLFKFIHDIGQWLNAPLNVGRPH